MPSLRVLAACLLLLAGGEAVAAKPSNELRIAGATITIDCDCVDGPSLEVLKPWIRDAAEAIQTYYGQFPVRQLRIEVTGEAGRGVFSGTTYTYRGALIRVSVGRDSSVADLKKDWVMTHEMVHLTQPEFDHRFGWVQEGLAVYVEPIARAQTGQLSDEKVWGDMMRDMAKGLPATDDRGLNNTHTWGRTYWGGAMFFLLADVGIREQTNNRIGIQQVLRAMLDKRGEEASFPELVQAGDRATRTKALSTLYGQMADAPVSPDLDTLWKRLGVKLEDGKIVFDDSAPLAETRRAITQRSAP